MPNKPDKFSIKFWMTVDVESKYLYNRFPYLGKDLARSGDASMPTNVMKLMSPLFRQGFNVRCNNYFTSLDLLLRLTKQQCCLVMTIRANQREIVDLKKCMLHDIMLVHYIGCHYSDNYYNYSDCHFLSVQTVEVCKHFDHPT